MQISEKRNTLSPKSEKGKRRLSGWDNIIWKMKQKPNALPPPSFLPTPFNRRKETSRSAKVREILQFSYYYFVSIFVGGASVCLPPPLSKTGLNPTSGCYRERLPRKFGGRERGGCFLEGEPRQGRWEEEPKEATDRKRPQSPVSWEERLKRGGRQREDGGV